jgi:hypothetical protein
MPAPEPAPGEPLTAAAFDAALVRAGIAASPAERERALIAARRLREAMALLRAWNAGHGDEPA